MFLLMSDLSFLLNVLMPKHEDSFLLHLSHLHFQFHLILYLSNDSKCKSLHEESISKVSLLIQNTSLIKQLKEFSVSEFQCQNVISNTILLSMSVNLKFIEVPLESESVDIDSFACRGIKGLGRSEEDRRVFKLAGVEEGLLLTRCGGLKGVIEFLRDVSRFEVSKRDLSI
jgi:hypothetical protein